MTEGPVAPSRRRLGLTAGVAVLALAAWGGIRLLPSEIRPRIDRQQGLQLVMRDGTGALLHHDRDAMPDLERPRALGLLGRKSPFTAVWTGWLRIDEEGRYGFSTESDDGSWLELNGRRIVSNEGVHSRRQATGETHLLAGWHPIRVGYDQQGGRAYLDVRWDPPRGPASSLPPDRLTRRPPTWTGVLWHRTVGPRLAPLASPAGRILSDVGLGTALAALAALAVTGLRLRWEPLRARIERGLAPLVAAGRGSTPRTLGALVGIFLAAALVWLEGERSSWGLRVQFRGAREGGPWSGRLVDPGFSPSLTDPALETRWRGWVLPARRGYHWFSVETEGRTRLRVGGLEPAPQAGSRIHRVHLGRKAARIELGFRPGRRDGDVRVRWRPPGGAWELLPDEVQFAKRPGARKARRRLHQHRLLLGVRCAAGAWIALVVVAAGAARWRPGPRTP